MEQVIPSILLRLDALSSLTGNPRFVSLRDLQNLANEYAVERAAVCEDGPVGVLSYACDSLSLCTNSSSARTRINSRQIQKQISLM